MKRLLLVASFVLLAGGAVYFFHFAPARTEAGLNITLNAPPYQASAKARELHERLFVADLHADTLLWNRDLLERGTYGHADVPRLIEGNVALQAFTIVTKVPKDMKMEGNDPSTDSITLLAVAERWPVAAWSSLTARALHQAERLNRAAARSSGALTVVTTSQQLTRFIQGRQSNTRMIAGVLGVEGAQALDGNLDNLDRLFAAGVRMMAPTHLSDNDIGGSAHGIDKGGLTDNGKELVRRMESRKMLVDLAHASAKTFDDTVTIATRPVVVSHAGVMGTCDNVRNLSDDQLKAVANTGGIVGIGYWDTATCGKDATAVARAIRHAVGVMGIAHVGLGSDFDGAVIEPFDSTGLVQVTDALLANGFNDVEIQAIMGGNVVRLLLTTLPATTSQ
jgi:microsomal dipeptidase-like Zn-dependent dipeptidase